ncbi:MAG: 30S ribosome-binding factor RbfA [Candidatus Cloacimonadota bacterium]|nr:MAG: 30S ribosome-binding factor RbfA [Candidatus Cloacimonadota bacterium]
MTSFHVQRIEEEIKKEVSKIVAQELDDPRIGFVTISRVSLNRDLRLAHIFITVFNQTNKTTTLIILNRAKKHVRWLLAQRMRFRRVPDISFQMEDDGS